MISDSEIARRLHELADAGGPWDDPLPAIRRRAAESDGPDAAGVNKASNVLHLPVRVAGSAPVPAAGSQQGAMGGDDDSATGWDAKVLRPDRRRLGWKVPAAAAAVVAGLSGVVGLARLIPASDSMKSSSTADAGYSAAAGAAQRRTEASVGGASAAASAGSTAGGSAAASAAASSAAPPASTSAASRSGYAGLTCSPAARHTATVTVVAPAQVRAGERVSAVVSVGANLRRPATGVEIYVVGARSDAVIGALRGSVSSVTRLPSTLRGTLQRWSCTDGIAPSRSSAVGRALPPGTYRLVAVLLPVDGTAPVVSSPVSIHILSAIK